MDKSPLLCQIAVTLLPNIGPVLAKNLISYCGGVAEIFNASYSKLIKIPGIGSQTAKDILNADILERAEQEIDFIRKHKIQPLFYLDEKYPQRLKNCYDNPVMLYYKGNADLNASKIVSIVGTRKATEYGKMVCENLIQGLIRYDVLVVSGLAYGIDICAHKTSLDKGLKTVGVVGHGLDIIYPAQHRPVAEKMIKQGGLISEFTSKSRFEKENFPKRNRVIAGMADAVIVIETMKKGGSVITAEIANSYNRDVFAIPGNINLKYSEGCNFLIRTNKAQLLDATEELALEMGWQDQDVPVNKPLVRELFVELNENEKLLVETLKNSALAIDELSVKVNLPSSAIASNLLNLEFKGLVKSLPGKIYQLIN